MIHPTVSTSKSAGKAESAYAHHETGQTVNEAVWWFITMERSCQVQLLAEAAAAGTGQALKIIDEGAVRQAFLFWGKEQKAYAFVTFAGVVIALVALLVSSLRFN